MGKAPGEGFPGLLGRFFRQGGGGVGWARFGAGWATGLPVVHAAPELVHALEPMGAGRRPHRPR